MYVTRLPGFNSYSVPRARAPRPPIAGRTPAARATPRGATRAPGHAGDDPRATHVDYQHGRGRQVGWRDRPTFDPFATCPRRAAGGWDSGGVWLSGSLGCRGGRPPFRAAGGRATPAARGDLLSTRPLCLVARGSARTPQAGGGGRILIAVFLPAPIKKDSSYAISFLYELFLINSIV